MIKHIIFEFYDTLDFFIENIDQYYKLANVGSMYSFAPMNLNKNPFKYLYLDLNAKLFWGCSAYYKNVSRQNAIKLNDSQYEFLKLRLL